MTDIVKSILLGIVEGVTEFLPISSTGHLLLAQSWMGMEIEGPNADPFWLMFTVFIQIGAIASVLVYFRGRILELLRHGPRLHDEGGNSPPRSIRLLDNRAAMLVLIGSLPLIGAFFAEKWSEKYLYGVLPVALALGIGGILIILIEKLRPTPRTQTIEAMTFGQALLIGCCQVLAAVFPGTSRSAATILGGLTAGLSREAAAEFSFFLAIPAMFGACGYKLLKQITDGAGLTTEQWLVLLVGTAVSFLVAWAVIAFLMRYIRKHSFIPFAIYRILLAGVVLIALSD